jgi:hypothetical protein
VTTQLPTGTPARDTEPRKGQAHTRREGNRACCVRNTGHTPRTHTPVLLVSMLCCRNAHTWVQYPHTECTVSHAACQRLKAMHALHAEEAVCVATQPRSSPKGLCCSCTPEGQQHQQQWQRRQAAAANTQPPPPPPQESDSHCPQHTTPYHHLALRQQQQRKESTPRVNKEALLHRQPRNPARINRQGPKPPAQLRKRAATDTSCHSPASGFSSAKPWTYHNAAGTPAWTHTQLAWTDRQTPLTAQCT